MELAAHDPSAAKRLGIPRSVGEDFVHADQSAGKHFAHPKVDHNGHRCKR
jgi:hypothetical protein